MTMADRSRWRQSVALVNLLFSVALLIRRQTTGLKIRPSGIAADTLRIFLTGEIAHWIRELQSL